MDRVLSSDKWESWIKSRYQLFFQYRDKTSEYSEIYREQLTSEHFLPYNYRSSTLPRISRNIGRLLRQCTVCVHRSARHRSIRPRCASPRCACSYHAWPLPRHACPCCALFALWKNEQPNANCHYRTETGLPAAGQLDCLQLGTSVKVNWIS